MSTAEDVQETAVGRALALDLVRGGGSAEEVAALARDNQYNVIISILISQMHSRVLPHPLRKGAVCGT